MTKLTTLRQELNLAYPERSAVIDGALCALLAKRHCFLLGPPGTGKSALIRTISQSFGAVYFERLIMKGSVADEFFGPVSLVALQADSFRRNTTGKLPEAEVAFIDELWKGSAALCNSFLSVLNEGIYHNDQVPMRVPLHCCYAASNELPENDAVEALYDRFMVRFDLSYLLKAASFRQILTMTTEPHVNVSLTMDDLRAEQKATAAVVLTDPTVDAIIAIRDALRATGVVASDRRWRQMLGVIRANAHLSGDTETTPEDLMIAIDCLWRTPTERPAIARIVGQIADPASAKAVELVDAARETAAKVQALSIGTTPESRKNYMSAASQAIPELKDQIEKLRKLKQGSSRRSGQCISDAEKEVTEIHTDMSRTVSAAMGLSTRR